MRGKLVILVACIGLLAAACDSDSEPAHDSVGGLPQTIMSTDRDGGISPTSAPEPLASAAVPASTAAPDTSVVDTTVSTLAPTSTTEPVTTTAAPTTTASANCEAFSGYGELPQSRMLIRAPAANGKPLPVVMVLHGYTGTPESIESTSGMTATAQAKGYMVVYPEGAPVPKSEGFGWNSGSKQFSNPGRDDVAQLSKMIVGLVQNYCADKDRIILSGESNGAAMAIRAACEPGFGNMIKAVVTVIPAVDSGVVSSCKELGTVPRPFLSVASGNDKTIVYEGDGNFTPQVTWFDFVAKHLNKCDTSAAPLVQNQPTYVTRQHQQGCVQPAQMVKVLDGTHTWPGGPKGTGGLKPGTFDTNAAILALMQ